MKRAVVLAAAATVALVLAREASAHAIVSPPVAKSKVLQQFTLSVPTEEKGATTRFVQLSFPKGFVIDSFEPSPGWKRVERGQSVMWNGDKVPTGEAADFRFNASLDATRTYVFDVRQTYSDGKVVEWNGPESSDTPAPSVDGVSSLGGGSTTTLTIVALIVAVVGVLLGIVGLATRGRPLA
jgi:uncharacterized protein YcnI